MDDISTNVIDLRSRVAELRFNAVAKNAAEATAELQSLRATLHNLAMVLRDRELSGKPLQKTDQIHQLLDDLAAELSQCMHMLGLPPD